MSARRFAAVTLGALVAVVLSAASAAAQGRVTGIVTAEGGAPLPNVQVQLEGTAFGAMTAENGRYTITNVPAGVYTVEARRIGYAQARQENIRVAGAEVTVNFAMQVTALKLQREVVTGLVDPTSGIKAPFVIEKVETPEVPPPPGSPVSAIQGKVAGALLVRPEGKPGSEITVQLRTPTSINKNTEPVYVVDGVVLGGSTVDFNGLDIESIEIIKGAAASSLYGSRAANGVIQIRTRRGDNLELDRTTISVRSEYGGSQMIDLPRLNRSHGFRMNADQTAFVDASGNTLSDTAYGDRASRVNDPVAIMDNPYPGPTFDHMDALYRPGQRFSNYLTIGSNTQATNWFASIGNEIETGVLEFNDGLRANSGRLNVDHRLTEKLNVAFSGYHARSRVEDYAGVNPFYDILFQPADVNLLADNFDGEPFIVKPDPQNNQANPLYALSRLQSDNRRMRTTANATANYRPASWLTLEGLIGYDQATQNFRYFEPKGMKLLNWDLDTPGAVSLGAISRNESQKTALNGQLGASFLYSFDQLTTRTTFRGLFESQQADSVEAGTSNLSVEGVPSLNAGSSASAASLATRIETNGMLGHTSLDYAGRYIADVLLRRDGSSLFGPEDRYHWYYRVSGAYRMAEEPWWPVAAITEFKLRASRGTAGGRPNFADRFETWNVTESGISKTTLGNRELRPELATETEIGLDMILQNRYSISLTHAYTLVEDQLLAVPQPAVTGYQEQWRNAGKVEGRTIEGTIDAQLLSRPDMRWNLGLVFDRNRNEILELDAPCYRENYRTNSQGTGSQNQTVGWRCPGVTLGTLFGAKLVRSASELPAAAQARAAEFQVNDDGILVWVGPGSSYTDAGANPALWATSAAIGGRTYRWGRPIKLVQTNLLDSLVKIGDGNPDFNWGMTNTFTWRNLTLYGNVSAQVGGDIYNHTKQWSYRDDQSADQDQAVKPLERRKSIDYYQDLYNTDATLDWFVEDGSFVKLRELSLRYDMPRARIAFMDRIGMQGLSVGLIGRNLVTWTDYSGFDPEVGTANHRVDDFGYPQFRTFTGFVELKF